MSHCVVPNWDVEQELDVVRVRPHPSRSNNSSSGGPDVRMLDYEMAELTWENGQLSLHSLGRTKPNLLKCATAGTLESIVNLATRKPPDLLVPQQQQPSSLVPCFGSQPPDALVPQQQQQQQQHHHQQQQQQQRPLMMSCRPTPVDSCSSGPPKEDGSSSSVARVPGACSLSASLTASGTLQGLDSWHVPTTTSNDKELLSFTNTNDYDSVCHSRPQESAGTDLEQQRKRNNAKSSSSTRRTRAAAIHNQSERKRRDKINQKMKMLQKLVPNSNKTDKASMLDEVIEYLKQLQAHVNMMNRMSVVPSSMNMNMNMNMNMMMPAAAAAAAQLAMQQQQQLQMSMMAAAAAAATAPMGMAGMGPMGMAGMSPMDMNQQMATRQNQQLAFMPPSCWDVVDRAQLPPTTTIVDPISTYLACQPQPMTIEAYSRMIALIQQQQQQQLASVSKH